MGTPSPLAGPTAPTDRSAIADEIGPQRLAGAPPPEGPYDADILILALDRAADTMEAIDSALAQTGVRRHVTVIDQGSEPVTIAALTAHIAGRTDAVLWSAGRNRGVAGGRNLGAALGHGRVIVGLDNDAVFAAGATVAALVATLDTTPDLAALGMRILAHASGRDDLSSWGYPLALLPRAGESFDIAAFVGAGHAIRRTAWDAAGPYDERLFFCWEEYDFCLRAIAAGWRVRYCGDLAVRHKGAAERRVQWSQARWFLYVRNRLLIERKWGASWLRLAPRAAGYVVKGALGGLGWQGLRAIGAAARMDPGTDRHRLPPASVAYLRRVDGQHRGNWRDRLRREIFAPPGAPPLGGGSV